MEWLEELGQLLLSAALVVPVAWNRERRTELAGLRTFPLAAFASCAFVMIGLQVQGAGNAEAQPRIMQGLITGIGFIGGGAILKRGGEVHGTSTAAGIWAASVVGLAVAHHRYVIAFIVATFTYLAFRLLTPVERRLDRRSAAESSAGADESG
jgi:putative Mg2+ transporter-C (MgtC) family protein